MNNKYSGFTLIETIIVFAAETFVIGLGVGVLFMVTETRIKEYRGDSVRSSLSRLSEQFRTDLHTATTSQLENNSLRLTFPNEEELVYSIEHAEFPEQSILRRNKIHGDKKIATETFTLPDHSVAWFVFDKDAGLIALNIWTQPVDRRGQILVTIPKKEDLNPFTREITGKDKIGIDPRYAGNWRTIIVKINQ
jgi:type II secretory pathway pseudopilin PulG